MKHFLLLATLLIGLVSQAAEPAHIEIDFARQLGPMKMNQMALGQGGLSSDIMFGDRIGELRALRPKIIRLFIQEYFDLLPAPGQYNFAKLDPAVDAIVATGAEPLMCICFKPRALFPEINQDKVEPNDYAAWQALVTALVTHYKQRGTSIHYWEIGNEPDIGEDGGCPYRFQPVNYARYYKNTADAIARGDSDARIGGPALANVRSPILPALIDFCANSGTPLHFVSWHIYSTDPNAIRGTVEYVHQQLRNHPVLKPETFLDEWNMDLMNPPLDPRFQPCYIAETIYQMKEAELDYSCYYHIRDWHVASGEFSPFMSPRGTAFMTRWWNRMPQFDGLFDFQNRVRPSYFAFKLLSRVSGNRLAAKSDTPGVHALAAHDLRFQMHNLLIWNFSGSDFKAEILLRNLPADVRTRHVQLDAVVANDDENVRLRPDPFQKLTKGDQRIEVQLDSFAMHYWSIE
jgi:xylan 1,4-beta-xylosidase